MAWSESAGRSIDYAECVECGARDFVSARYYDRQAADFPEVVAKLPEELRRLFGFAEPQPISTPQAARELFDY
jgi:hypothetical protein